MTLVVAVASGIVWVTCCTVGWCADPPGQVVGLAFVGGIVPGAEEGAGLVEALVVEVESVDGGAVGGGGGCGRWCEMVVCCCAVFGAGVTCACSSCSLLCGA